MDSATDSSSLPSSAPVPAPPFADFDALSRHLDARGFFRITPGLERIRQVLEHFDLERRLPCVFQVLGTNGKGSTATFLASLARAHGLKTGLYTSPHFVTLRERTRIDGAMLSEEDWVRLGNKALAAAPDLTYFEFTTAVAVLAFAEERVDAAVLEAGLGGSWDATTAVRADCTLFAPIDLDHTAILGPTVSDIARDKAGAIRAAAPAFSARQNPDALKELENAARKMNTSLTIAGGLESLPAPIRNGSIRLGIGGAYQTDNAALALAAWRAYAARRGIAPDAEKETTGLAAAFIPGRFQRIPAGTLTLRDTPLNSTFYILHSTLPALLLDGAHNPHGLAGLGRALAAEGVAPAAVIFSCLADKDIGHILPHLRALATGPVFIPPIEDNPRAMDPAALALAMGTGATAVPSLDEALRRAAAVSGERGAGPRNPVLVCGSLYLLGQFFEAFPQALESLP